MRILLIEDESNKAKQVTECINKIDEDMDLSSCKSYSSALVNLNQYSYDLIILDMSLPLYDVDCEPQDTNEFDTFAGLEILSELKRKKQMVKVIVFTAFDILGENDNKMSLFELDEQIQENFPELYLGCIHYNTSSLEWKTELIKNIELLKKRM